MKRKKLIDNIINYMVENKYENCDILKEQYLNSDYELNEDVVGFNLFLLKYKGKEKLTNEFYEIDTIGGKYQGQEVGFTIFIRDGILDEIEGYTYGNVAFPESDDLELFEIKYQ